MYKAEEELGENADYLFPEIDNLDFEADLDKAFEEIEALHRDKNNDESLEKAVSTEDIASAKTRGLVPKSGNWQKPGRWVRPKDADVPVDEGEKPRKPAEYMSTPTSETMKALKTVFGDDFDKNDLTDMYSIGIDGFGTDIRMLDGRGDSVDIQVSIYDDSDESYAGVMERTFSRDKDGKLTVYHSRFRIEIPHRKKGIAADISENVEKEYERLGVSEIRLQANAEIGGYAWARQGYDFSTKNELEEMQDMFSWNIERMKELSVSEEEELIDQVQGFAHSWQFAAWNPTNSPHGQHLGKELMLRTNWHAKKTLDKKSKGYKIGKGYFAAKRNEKNTA